MKNLPQQTSIRTDNQVWMNFAGNLQVRGQHAGILDKLSKCLREIKRFAMDFQATRISLRQQ